jgi:DNA ligase-1
MSNDFNQMQQSAFASKRGTTVGDVKYHVFGWISIDEWNSDIFKMPTQARLANLALTIANADPARVGLVQQQLIYKVEDVIKAEVDFMAQGYEGAMVLPNIPYYRGRKSNKLMKFKTMHSMDCKVVGLYEGEGKHAGRMGGLKLTQENGLACDVGSGFTDEDRAMIWNDPSCAVGRTAEIKYQELTPDGVMRFPVFLRWRNDK